MTKREKLLNYIESLYTPVSLIPEKAKLQKIVMENDYYEEIATYHQNSVHNDCLIIETKGNGSRATFKGFYIARVDIGNVGYKFADVAIYKPGCTLATPTKVTRYNKNINIPRD